MIKYFEGTIFNVDTQTMVNTVNCTGVMGAGIALEFMLRYPAMFEDMRQNVKIRGL
jgi:O-acetyl-ADP-ribose deacetylase (regulator of RNase III)